MTDLLKQRHWRGEQGTSTETVFTSPSTLAQVKREVSYVYSSSSLPKAAGTEQTLDIVYWSFGFYSSLTFQQIFNSQSIWVCVIAYLIVPITWLDDNQDSDKLGKPRVLSKPPRVLESEIVVQWKCAVQWQPCGFRSQPCHFLMCDQSHLTSWSSSFSHVNRIITISSRPRSHGCQLMYQLVLFQFSLKFSNSYANIMLSSIHIFAWMFPLH